MAPKHVPAALWRAVSIPVTPREGAACAAVCYVAASALLALLPGPGPARVQAAPAPVAAPLPDLRRAPGTVQVLPQPAYAPKLAVFTAGTADATRWRQLNGYYVGQSMVGRVDWNKTDLAASVQLMWARKQRTFRVTPATAKAVRGIVRRYRAAPHQTTTLAAYARRADRVVNRARNGMDWPGLCARFRVASDRCVRLQYMAGRIDGEMLVAYGMTELMPSRDGQVNAGLLDLVLRKAGADYLNVVPALGDKYLSLGLYQFTSYAVRHDAEGRQGANCVAEYGKYRIGGSVLSLTPDQQHAAAFYFATYNLLRMVNTLSSRQYANLRAHSPLSRADLTVFMATSHHAPGKALGSARAWLQEGARPGGLARYQRGDNVVYAAKSKANLAAL